MKATDEMVEAGVAIISDKWVWENTEMVRDILDAALAHVGPEPVGESLDDFAEWFDEQVGGNIALPDPEEPGVLVWDQEMGSVVASYRDAIRQRAGTTEGVGDGDQ